MAEYHGTLSRWEQEQLTYALAALQLKCSIDLEISRKDVADFAAWAFSDTEMRDSYLADEDDALDRLIRENAEARAIERAAERERATQ